MLTRTRALRLAIASFALVALLAGCSSDSTTTTADSATTSTALTSATELRGGGGEVVSQILGQIEPPEAPGYTLYLYQVEIPAGASIAPHHHPGQQVARIQAGTLTYTVIDGTAQIARDGSSTPTESVTGPQTVTLEAGDTVFEPETMTHEAANNGDVPVEVLLSSLFSSDQKMSIPAGG